MIHAMPFVNPFPPFLALALTLSFFTVCEIANANSCPKGMQKDSISTQQIKPESSREEVMSPRSLKNRTFEKKRFLQQNKPRWT
ncbi:MAG: hypothetical protein V4563_15370 [Pseudomonadota bacterium]